MLLYLAILLNALLLLNAWLILRLIRMVMALKPAPHVSAAPHVPLDGGAIYVPTEHDVQILKAGEHLGWRPAGHPDIEEALQHGNDLSVRWPDGRVQETKA